MQSTVDICFFFQDEKAKKEEEKKEAKVGDARNNRIVLALI